MNFRILFAASLLLLSGCSDHEPVHVSGKVIGKTASKKDDSYFITTFNGGSVGSQFVASDKTVFTLTIVSANPLDYSQLTTNWVDVTMETFNSVNEGDAYSQ